MIFCTWGRLEPALEGYRRRGFPAGQSSRRDQCAGTSPFNSLHACARMDRHSCVTHRSAPPPHHPLLSPLPPPPSVSTPSPAVGALPLGFQVKLGLARGKYLPAGLHAAEASYVFSSSISAFRAAIVRAVWSSKMPLANAIAILNLLDGPVGVDPAFHIVWSRLRMMRRYLAYNPDEEFRIFRLLDLISRRLRVMVPFICFLSLLLTWGLLGMERSEVGSGSPSLP